MSYQAKPKASHLNLPKMTPTGKSTRNRKASQAYPATLALLALTSMLAVAGCSGDEPTGRDAAAQATVDGDGNLAVSTEDTGGSCPIANQTQACSCGEASGRQLCSIGLRWGLCECLDPEAANRAGDVLSAADPPANKAAATFNWLRTEPGAGGGGCRPGHYGGALDGIYNAPSAFTAPVPIVSVDVTGAPGFQIDLAESGNGEFLTVTGGGLNGVALAIFPFKADFADGMLDCSTGLLRARIINGSYIVFFDGFYGGDVMYEFEGELVARYDAATNSLVDGRWAVSEGSVAPPAISPDEPVPLFPIGQAGGSGTWTAKWMSF